MTAPVRKEETKLIRIDTSSMAIEFKEFDRLELMSIRDNVREIWTNLTMYVPSLRHYVQQGFQDKELLKELQLTYYSNASRMGWPSEREQEELMWQIRNLITLLCVLAGTRPAIELLEKSVYGCVRGMINPAAKISLIDKQPVSNKFQTEAVGNVMLAVSYARYPTKPFQGLSEIFTTIQLNPEQQLDIVRGALALVDRQTIVFN